MHHPKWLHTKPRGDDTHGSADNTKTAGNTKNLLATDNTHSSQKKVLREVDFNCIYGFGAVWLFSIISFAKFIFLVSGYGDIPVKTCHIKIPNEYTSVFLLYI